MEVEISGSRRMIITGAGQRIGAAIAEYFAAQGWHLVLHYHRSKSEAEALAARIATLHGQQVVLKHADLGDVDDVASFWSDLPLCDAIVHNAATFVRDTLDSVAPATFYAQLQVNFSAPMLLMQGFMDQLPSGADGNAIILGDGSMGWSISPEFFSYAVSKQAWVGALDVLAAACAPRARVNMLALAPTLPGPGDTPEMFARLAQRVPLQRTGTAEEVCHAIGYLLAAPGVTGQTIALSGGAHLLSQRPNA